MLVRILEYNYDADDFGKSLEDGKFIAATEVKDYNTFLSMMQNMVGKDIVIEDEWYTYEGDYYLSFPKTDDSIMCLNIFVCGY